MRWALQHKLANSEEKNRHSNKDAGPDLQVGCLARAVCCLQLLEMWEAPAPDAEHSPKLKPTGKTPAHAKTTPVTRATVMLLVVKDKSMLYKLVVMHNLTRSVTPTG